MGGIITAESTLFVSNRLSNRNVAQDSLGGEVNSTFLDTSSKGSVPCLWTRDRNSYFINLQGVPGTNI